MIDPDQEMRWRDRSGRYGQHPGYAPSELQKKIADSVRSGLEKGLTTLRDLTSYASQHLAIQMCEVGMQGMVYKAKEYVQAQQWWQVKQAAAKEMRLTPQVTLGTLMLSDRKLITGCRVTQVHIPSGASTEYVEFALGLAPAIDCESVNCRLLNEECSAELTND